MTLLERLRALFGREDIASEDDVVGLVQTMIGALKKLRESIDVRWQVEDAARAALPNDAGDLAVIGGYVEHAAAQLVDMANAVQARAAQDADIAAREQSVGVALAQARAAFAAEREARVVDLVNQAVADGRILPAHAETRKAAILAAADFGAALRDLVNACPQIKTRAKVPDLGERAGDLRGRQEKILELVNTRMTDTHEDYTAAFSAIRNMEEHAALFENEP